MEVVKEAMRLAFVDRHLDRLAEQRDGIVRRLPMNGGRELNDGLLILALSRGNIDSIARILADRSGISRELVAFKLKNFQAVQMRLLCRAAGVASLHTNILVDVLRVARRRKMPLRATPADGKSWKGIVLSVLNFYGANVSPQGTPVA